MIFFHRVGFFETVPSAMQINKTMSARRIAETCMRDFLRILYFVAAYLSRPLWRLYYLVSRQKVDATYYARAPAVSYWVVVALVRAFVGVSVVLTLLLWAPVVFDPALRELVDLPHTVMGLLYLVAVFATECLMEYVHSTTHPTYESFIRTLPATASQAALAAYHRVLDTQMERRVYTFALAWGTYIVMAPVVSQIINVYYQQVSEAASDFLYMRAPGASSMDARVLDVSSPVYAGEAVDYSPLYWCIHIYNVVFVLAHLFLGVQSMTRFCRIETVRRLVHERYPYHDDLVRAVDWNRD